MPAIDEEGRFMASTAPKHPVTKDVGNCRGLYYDGGTVHEHLETAVGAAVPDGAGPVGTRLGRSVYGPDVERVGAKLADWATMIVFVDRHGNEGRISPEFDVEYQGPVDICGYLARFLGERDPDPALIDDLAIRLIRDLPVVDVRRAELE